MIVVRLCGGLGNQLFQYAFARVLALRHSTEVVLDLSWYKNIPVGNTKRVFELDKYGIFGREASPSESRWFVLHQGRIVTRLNFIPRRWKHIRESGFDFSPPALELPDNVYLDGYWQSYMYLEGMESTLREELTPNIPLSAADKNIADQINKSNSVSLHVRRGDYVSNKSAAKNHGLCSLDYYREAVALVQSKLSNPRFFVFSDDPAWSKENLPLPDDSVFVTHNDSETAFQDLRLMSMCHHQVIANSSFSWWGAWLNSHVGKIVIAPRQWFGDARETPTLIPKEWIRL